MAKDRAKNIKKPKSKSSLFLGYPDYVIVTGKFSSSDDSIDEVYRTPPQVGDKVRLNVDDPIREGHDLVCKVLALDTEQDGDFTNITLQLFGGWRIAISH